MRTITIQISDSDYDDAVQHFANDRLGRPLVAVVRIVEGPHGETAEELLAEERADEKATVHVITVKEKEAQS